MSTILMATLVMMAPPGDQPAANSTTPLRPAESRQAGARVPRELLAAIRAALRSEATAKDATERREAVRELVSLYEELRADKQMNLPQRREYLSSLRSRLLKFHQHRTKEMAQARKHAEGGQRPASVALTDRARGILAQQLGGMGGAFGGPGGAAGGPGGVADDGDKLVELIQTVVAPGHWEPGGGIGTIQYWPGLRALVVRASQDVHGEVDGVLDQIRRAGN